MVQHHSALDPGLLQVCALLVKNIKFLLDLWAGIVPMSQQLLPKLLKCLESASPGINFCPVFLPRGEKGLGNLLKMLILVLPWFPRWGRVRPLGQQDLPGVAPAKPQLQ